MRLFILLFIFSSLLMGCEDRPLSDEYTTLYFRDRIKGDLGQMICYHFEDDYPNRAWCCPLDDIACSSPVRMDMDDYEYSRFLRACEERGDKRLY